MFLTFSDVGVTLKLKKKKHSSGFGNWVGPINIEQIQGLFKNVCVTTDIYWYFVPFLNYHGIYFTKKTYFYLILIKHVEKGMC